MKEIDDYIPEETQSPKVIGYIFICIFILIVLTLFLLFN